MLVISAPPHHLALTEELGGLIPLSNIATSIMSLSALQGSIFLNPSMRQYELALQIMLKASDGRCQCFNSKAVDDLPVKYRQDDRRSHQHKSLINLFATTNISRLAS